ncbi:Ger(x)C family spore germination protein [Psychrobacillus sp. FSL K6-2684]|uniref:Ger(X)C family spore germination protein n=1 Tax=Psychrobacillus faecigallinarum TaxID=2762235 RepID=A0ABR8R788_9BACI|nr:MULTISPECIES: Ger(x)C family spore germination protein [Psychrobacillus]MBD7943658.1 Ger(x)C family spore germination protein [Psychrobacillus faecigallinarum]QEY22806.1 Ger(x)C family spore germination protein [Psychrobacillus sp. AK 1817]
MKRRIKQFCIICCLLPLLTSCWDADEPNKIRYIYGVGIDYKDGKYEIYAQIVDFINIAKTDQPIQDAIQAEVGRAKGNTVEEAFFELYQSMDLKLFWGHMTYLVFSEEALKEGRANTIINSFLRYREIRYQTWIYATKDSVEDVLLLDPLFNNALTRLKLADPMNSYQQESFIEPIDFRKLVIRLNEPSHEVNIPYIKIDDKWNSNKEKDKLPKFDGIGILTPKDLKGFVTGDKINGLQWMSKETKRGEITVPREDEFVTIVIDNLKIDVEPKIQGEEVKFDIKLNMNALLSGFEGTITEKEVRSFVKKQIKKEVEETYLEGLDIDVDIYRLSEYMYRKDLEAWKKVQKDGKVPLTENSISNLTVDVNKVYSGRKSFRETVE